MTTDEVEALLPRVTRYNAIVLDPPWPYERTRGEGIAEHVYHTMSWADLRSLGPLISGVATPNAAILLWVTSPLLLEITDVVRAWGFRYITKAFCWLKTYRNGAFAVGCGSQTLSNTEDVWLLSLSTPRRRAADVSQVIWQIQDEPIIAQRHRHSRKPEELYRRLERYVDGPYLDLFARRRRPGWTCLGNELDGLDIRESLRRLAVGEPLPILEQDQRIMDLSEVA